ncbi:TSUP family transporter [Oceaniglobus roseus]|uniref:TSUP family transporter n=1 Tax=Oceaniglobus roseus TaxID=1737570 RepID=UPI001FE3AD48|nr:TSUP family transporter [Kandeliimicrobium roseum]
MTDLVALLMPPDLGGMAVAAMVGVSFIASLVTVAFGIGGGGLLLAVLAVLMPPAALIPVHGVVQVGSNLGRAVVFVRHTAWSAMPWFVVGSIVGVTAGGSVVINLPPWAVQVGVGGFIVWTVLACPPRWLSHWPLLTGVISSFLTMFFGATGLFVASYSKSLKLARHAFVATHATLMCTQHLLKTLVFGLLGFAFAPWAGLIAAMIAAGLLGTLTGRLVLNRMTDARFNRALDLVLLLISARLIWSGLAERFWP